MQPIIAIIINTPTFTHFLLDRYRPHRVILLFIMWYKCLFFRRRMPSAAENAGGERDE